MLPEIAIVIASFIKYTWCMNARDLIKNNRYCTDHFNRDEYPVLFERMKAELEKFFSETPEESFDAEISDMLDEVNEHSENHRWKFRKESAMADDHLLLSLFIAPAAAAIGTPKAVKFAEMLSEAWIKRYPGSKFKIGNYDEIMEGFKWKISLPFNL